MILAVAAVAASAQAPAPAPDAEASDWVWKPILEARLRAESFETPAAAAGLDRDYDLYLGRARVGGEVTWAEKLTVRGIVQGAFAGEVPDDAAFGTGQTIFNTNGGDTSPDAVAISELALIWKGASFTLALGRQGWADGAGAATGVAHLDWVRTRRLGERLLGNVEFTNVARRYDGATLNWRPEGAGAFELFALRPLGGVQNYDQAFEGLDVDAEGLAWSTPHGAWIPKSSLRLFAQRYRDTRDVARSSTGDEIRIRTYGASILTGDTSWDLLAWGAIQRGDYGDRGQHAYAWLAEVGYRFLGVPGEPSVHFSWEEASGGSGPGENRSFWNGLPTNHKFYGSLDYFAFSNLRDLLVETRWSPTKTLAFTAAFHDFRLVDRGSAWVSGTGAMSDRELGYSFRLPSSGRYDSSDLGREFDLSAAWTFVPRATLKFEGGMFIGGDAAKQALPVESDGAWAILELSWIY